MKKAHDRNLLISDKELVELARRAMDHAYAPYSKFKVGAALVTETGEIYTGANVENASYGLTVCAERVAIFKAVSEGHRRIARIAVVSTSGDKTFPCGACRQVLKEFCPDAVVTLENRAGKLEQFSLNSLIPFAFGGDILM